MAREQQRKTFAENSKPKFRRRKNQDRRDITSLASLLTLPGAKWLNFIDPRMVHLVYFFCLSRVYNVQTSLYDSKSNQSYFLEIICRMIDTEILIFYYDATRSFIFYIDNEIRKFLLISFLINQTNQFSDDIITLETCVKTDVHICIILRQRHIVKCFSFK